jgi:hypothetical protein
MLGHCHICCGTVLVRFHKLYPAFADASALDFKQLGRTLPPNTEVPSSLESDDYGKFSPSFTLEVPAGHQRDQNTEDRLTDVERVFAGYVKVLQAKYGNNPDGVHSGALAKSNP